jgi:hypothetical protein
MFYLLYATVSGLVEGDTVARNAGVQRSDFIVAVNGQGFHCFAPNFKTEDLESLTKDSQNTLLTN